MHEKHRELLLKTAEGDIVSFQKLYVAFCDRVFNTAISHLQNQQDAEETTQDVFIEIFRSAGNFKYDSTVSTWIYRIAVNKCLDRLRYQKRKKRFALVASIFGIDGSLKHDKAGFEHPGTTLENKDKSVFIFKAIDLLPEQQKTAFVLAFIEQLPRQEIADVMNLSLKATESLLQRAKVSLRKELAVFYEQEKD
jgi:RNA polymerase sigma factor (sigma-70 family)